MTDEADNVSHKTPSTVNGPSNNRMVIAFPFSAVKINDPDETVAELAALVAELAGFVAANAPGPEAEELVSRARALAEKLER